jgi:hypothetical protein
MLNRFLIFLFLIIINSSCRYFEDCDGINYQIRVKEILSNGQCKYRADSIGDCLTWNDQLTITFVDTCNIYDMSEIVSRDELYRKYK